jgi:hypothetical protein
MTSKRVFLPDCGHHNIYHFLFYMAGNLRHLTNAPETIALNLSTKFQEPDQFVISILTKIFPGVEVINSSTCPAGFDTIKQDPPRSSREEPAEKEAYFFIKKKLLPHIEQYPLKKPLPDNIYITRKNTAHRILINENELSAFLNKNNFLTVDLEQTKGIQQMVIFNRAKKIICVHGAALSNILFCTEQTKIIEMSTPLMANLLHFSDIAKTFNLDYNRYNNLKEKTHDYNSHVSIDMDNIEELQKLL